MRREIYWQKAKRLVVDQSDFDTIHPKSAMGKTEVHFYTLKKGISIQSFGQDYLAPGKKGIAKQDDLFTV